MARIENPQIKTAFNIFRKKKVLSSEQLTTIMKCSTANLRLKLKKWKVHTSYNFRGKYYCLPEIPSFDSNGLWRYKGIYFSKSGTLKKTVVYLVCLSVAGLSGEDIGNIVKLSPRSFLHHLHDTPGMKREKHKRRFIYFSDNNDTYNKQVSRRRSFIEDNSFPSDSDAVTILIQFIKNPNVKIDELSNKIAKAGKCIDPNIIRRFLEYHNLQKKCRI